MKSEAFRDDLASRAFTGIQGDSLTFQVPSLARHPSTTAHAFSPHEPDSTQFVEDGYGVRYRRTCEAGVIRYDEVPPSLGRFRCDGSYQLEIAPASAEDRAARKSPKVTLTIDASWLSAEVAGEVANPDGKFDELADWMREHSAIYAGYANHVRGADLPGIAAMAAKNVQPVPEPVLSIAGEQVTEREIAQALQLLRGQSASAGKETPRGLMVVREFDHRLGAWNEA